VVFRYPVADVKLLEGLYLAIAAAVTGFGFAVPYLAHRDGAQSVPGWTWFVDPGPLSSRHAFLQKDCESCHTPHLGPTADRCIACHANESELLERAPTAFHAAIEDCRGCHVEHLGRARRPVDMQHEQLLRLALEKRGSAAEFVAAGPPPAAPHAGITRAEAQLACQSCHANQDRHRTLFGADCAQCHSVSAWTIPAFVHPSAQSRECVQCHQAPPSHYMEHFKMVSVTIAGRPHADVSQCFECHKTTAWNDIKGVGWYKHH